MSNAKKILEGAAALVEKGFTKYVSAKDESGFPCSATSSYACKFCMLGAINRATRNLGLPFEDSEEVKDHLRNVIGNRSISEVSDGGTQEEAVALLRKAAALEP